MNNFGFFQVCFKRRVFEKDNRLRKKKIRPRPQLPGLSILMQEGLPDICMSLRAVTKVVGRQSELGKQGRSVFRGFSRAVLSKLCLSSGTLPTGTISWSCWMPEIGKMEQLWVRQSPKLQDRLALEEGMCYTRSLQGQAPNSSWE